MWVWVIVILALIGGVAAVAVGRGGSLSEVYDDRPDATVPSGRPLTSDDLREVRFSTGVRGYRMDEVDALLARVRADLIAREEDTAVARRPAHVAAPAELSPAEPPRVEPPRAESSSPKPSPMEPPTPGHAHLEDAGADVSAGVAADELDHSQTDTDPS